MKKFQLLLGLFYLIATSFYPSNSENHSQSKKVVKEINLVDGFMKVELLEELD